MDRHPLERMLFEELDGAVNEVLRRYFDMYFDRAKATDALKRWAETRSLLRR